MRRKISATRLNRSKTKSGEVAEWNLALTYLKLDNDTSLKKTLDGIIQQKDHLYREQAEELLRSM